MATSPPASQTRPPTWAGSPQPGQDIRSLPERPREVGRPVDLQRQPESIGRSRRPVPCRCGRGSRTTAKSSSSPWTNAQSAMLLVDSVTYPWPHIFGGNCQPISRSSPPVHRGEQLHEVLALQRQQGIQRRLSCRGGVGQDDPLDQRPSSPGKHVLGAIQPVTLRAQRPGPGRVLRGVGVRPERQPPPGIGVRQQPVHRGPRRPPPRPGTRWPPRRCETRTCSGGRRRRNGSR